MQYKITEACVTCGACISECSKKAIIETDDHVGYQIINNLCDYCGSCYEICPVNAILSSEGLISQPVFNDNTQYLFTSEK